MTAAFGFIVGGGLILLAGLRGRSITEILQGVTSQAPGDSGVQDSTAPATTKQPAGPQRLNGNRALGYSMMIAAGFGPDQWPYLNKLWTQESGWDAGPKSVNKSSGAYGIPQANPSGGQGHPYKLNDPASQIRWGLQYIRQRYGSPKAAWAHEQAQHWY